MLHQSTTNLLSSDKYRLKMSNIHICNVKLVPEETYFFFFLILTFKTVVLLHETIYLVVGEEGKYTFR